MVVAGSKRKDRDLFSVKKRSNASTTDKKRKKQNKSEGNVQKKQKLEGFSAVEIHRLTYETLVDGQVLLGCVYEVQDYNVQISLPHRLKGTVTIARISNAYSALLTKVKENDDDDCEAKVHLLQELFKPGQYVVTRVLHVENVNNRFRVNLTLAPQEVNFAVHVSQLKVGFVLSCAVSSVEDNGFVMDTGISGVRAAFLKNTATDGAGIVGVGSIVRCIITHITRSDDTHTRLQLSADAEAVRKATLSITDTTNLSLLLPGTAISASISKVHREGLSLIMAGCTGVVHRLHLQKPLDRLNQYEQAQNVRARVLYITPLSKVVHFTLQKEVFASSPESDPLHGFNIGDTVEDAEIYQSSHSGVYVKIGKNCRGFCSGNRLSDNDKASKHVARDFPVGTKQICRVIQYDYMDQLFIVSFQKSVMEQQVIGYSEMQVGKIVKGIIKGYLKTGALVAVSKLVTGIVPFLHLTDTRMKHPEKKFKVGTVVMARVLRVNPENRNLILTCKKHLIESKAPIVTEYTKDIENTVTEGFIVKVFSAGLLIAMYNDVKGFAPKSLLSNEPVEKIEELFSEGQVVRCSILTVDPENKRMKVSLIIDGSNPFDKKRGKQLKLMSRVEMRERVHCVIKEVTEDSIKVSIQPREIKAEIPMYHLSDDINKSRLIKDLLHEGDEIYNAVVFKKYVDTVILTLKYSVYHWIYAEGKTCLNAEFLVSESYPAAVHDVRTYGLMASIPLGNHGQNVLVHVTNLLNSDNKMLKFADLGICVGQSISVTHKGEDRQGRPIVSSLLKDNLKNVTQSSIQLLYSYLKDEAIIRKRWLDCCDTKRLLARVRPGDKMKARVTAVTPLGLAVTLKEGKITGILSQDHQDVEAKAEVGQEIFVCVLCVNQEEECLELTAKPHLCECLHERATKEIKAEMTVQCEVLLAKKKFIMVMLKTRCKGKIVYMPSLRHINDFEGQHSLYTVGQNYHMVIKFVDGPLVLGVMQEHEKKEDLNILSELPSILFKSSVDAQPRKDELIETESDSLQEMALRKIERVVTDSQYSTKNVRSITKNINDKEKLKTLANDNVPQFDEETVQEIQKKRLQKKKLRLLEREKDEEVEGVATEDPQTEETNLNGSNNEVPKKKKLKENRGVSKKIQKIRLNTEVDEEDSRTKLKSPLKKETCLALGTGFVWEVPDSVNNLGEDSSESEDKEENKEKKVKKLTKSEREILAKEEEKRLHELELARLEKNRLPESALDYEELLQRSPNSSAMWIQFISFHLESAEVDKARAVARRALQVIDIREEEERLNIWTVLLRLEVLYGTTDSVGETYREALATNDQLKVHLAMAMVYAESNKLKEAEKVYFIMTKKFSQNCVVWIKAGIFFFSNNMADEARRYMEKALLSLDKKYHVKLINRFGQLEFRFGEAERGRTMFESLLSNYPKRIDIWSVYVDVLTKKEDIEGARHVLERMTGLKLRLRKMRTVFKKFLDFEKAHGSVQSVEAVRKRVEEFVASSLD